MLLHKAEGVSRFHSLVQTHMTERLFDHFNGPEGVLLDLEKGHLQLVRATDQLRERVTGTRENQTLRGGLQSSQLNIGAVRPGDHSHVATPAEKLHG